MTVKFGFLQVHKPTPAGLSRAVTIISVIIPVLLTWVHSEDNLLGKHASEVVTSLGILFIGLINALKPMFGVQIADNAKVAAKNVDVMENKT